MAKPLEQKGRTYDAVLGITAGWIIFSAWCNAIPWLLSPIDQLNVVGYSAAFVLSALVGFLILKKYPVQIRWRRILWKRWRKRMRRQPVFAVYFFILITAAIGGLIYPPTNHDGLTYRFPRVLHWLWENQWHWIDNPSEVQMNLSTHGYEWIMAILFALTGTDRLFFLVNLLSFALLPGLIFALLTRLGIGSRTASWWMWLMPCGYGLGLQAGGIGNDLFAIPYVLGGVLFALRAQTSQSRLDVAVAILAAAMVTATKLSNAPLVLPIGIALLPSWRWLFKPGNLPVLAGATLAGMLASALPVMLACTLETGHFSGDPENTKRLNIQNPAAGFIANTLQVTTRNAMPPVNPLAGAWNRSYEKWLPEKLTEFLDTHYPRFHLEWRELPQEEGDGLGLGISFLLVIAVLASGMELLRNRREPRRKISGRTAIVVGIVIATTVYFLKMGSEAAPRLLLPYYVVCLAFLLCSSANERLTRAKWWRVTAILAACFTLPAVILSPNRPLFPVQTILANLPDSVRSRSTVSRMDKVYRTYAVRNDAMAPLRNWIPQEVERVGLYAGGRSLRIGLWRPFGQRKVETIPRDISGLEIRERGFGAVVVQPELHPRNSMYMEAWSADRDLVILGSETVLNYAGLPPERYVVLIPESGR